MFFNVTSTQLAEPRFFAIINPRGYSTHDNAHVPGAPGTGIDGRVHVGCQHVGVLCLHALRDDPLCPRTRSWATTASMVSTLMHPMTHSVSSALPMRHQRRVTSGHADFIAPRAGGDAD